MPLAYHILKQPKYIQTLLRNKIDKLYSTSNKDSSNSSNKVKSKSDESNRRSDIDEEDQIKKLPALEPPEEPTTCCMSGCANCVWLEYAEKLTNYYKDGGEKSIKEINERISDPNIRAYILHEIRMRNKK